MASRVDVGTLDVLEHDARIMTTRHDHGIVLGIAADAVESSARVEETLGRADLAGKLVVEEARAVGEPVRLCCLGVGNALGKYRPAFYIHDFENRILAAVLRDSVDDLAAVGRSFPPIER